MVSKNVSVKILFRLMNDTPVKGVIFDLLAKGFISGIFAVRTLAVRADVSPGVPPSELWPSLSDFFLL